MRPEKNGLDFFLSGIGHILAPSINTPPMSHIIKQAELDWITDSLNETLAPTGAEFRWSRRYGYYAIDYTVKREGGSEGLITHRSGLTKSEAYQILYGMVIVASMTMDHRKAKAQDFLDYALGR
jgi:hypothetical protein